MICPACGYEQNQNRFCINCGSLVGEEKQIVDSTVLDQEEQVVEKNIVQQDEASDNRKTEKITSFMIGCILFIITTVFTFIRLW